ncbi:hypothetical protein VNI00_018419 [Paramarasmius palmivorus]|uniref:Uncharacterized protein n=1 Tax=Paramarasmius palmivorus TaxID=297713 RepID=A0AAW0B0Q5_9AGAR
MPATAATKCDIFTFEAIVDDFELSKRDEIDDIVDMYSDFEDDVQIRGRRGEGDDTSEVYNSIFQHVDQIVEFEDFNPQVSFETASSTPPILVVSPSPKRKTSKSPFPLLNMSLHPSPQTKCQSQKENIKIRSPCSKHERRITSLPLLEVMMSNGQR